MLNKWRVNFLAKSCGMLRPTFLQSTVVKYNFSNLLFNTDSPFSSSTLFEMEKSHIEKEKYVHSRESFLEFYPALRDQIINDDIFKSSSDFGIKWIKNMIDYNVPGGKLNRGMAVYDVLRSLKADQIMTDDDIYKANTVGWCIEWIQAFFLVSDDIVDGSITRRDQPCWYKNKDVGLIAINDSLLLECCVYRILKNNFQDTEYYGKIIELFQEATFQTAYGQCLDLLTSTSSPDKNDYTYFTVENYFNIITFKTSYYSFFLPIACGLVIYGIKSQEIFKLAKEILISMGQYFQVQDDYLDCFADPKLLGKIGTDIQDNKCSWLFCQALRLANDEQKERLLENYAIDKEENVAAVKDIYIELKLDQMFFDYEKESYDKLIERIRNQTLLPETVFTGLLDKIYRRKK